MESSDDLAFELAHVAAMDSAQWREIVDMCSVAYGEDFDDLLRVLPGTTHVLARKGSRLVSHVCWVTSLASAGPRETASHSLRGGGGDRPRLSVPWLRQRGDA